MTDWAEKAKNYILQTFAARILDVNLVLPIKHICMSFFGMSYTIFQGFPGGSEGKVSACSVGNQVRSLGVEDPLEKEMATHSSTLTWKIPWTKESGRL